MRVTKGTELFHDTPVNCDPDTPLIVVGKEYMSREELEANELDPCPGCFPDW